MPLIKPEGYRDHKKERTIYIKCEICNKVAADGNYRIHPNYPKNESNIVHACKKCGSKFIHQIEIASQELKLYNGIIPEEIIIQIRREHEITRDEIIDEWPTDPSFYTNEDKT